MKNISAYIKGLCHLICYTLKKLKAKSCFYTDQLMCFKTMFRRWNSVSCFNGWEDELGLKHEKVGPIFSSFKASYARKNHPK